MPSPLPSPSRPESIPLPSLPVTSSPEPSPSAVPPSNEPSQFTPTSTESSPAATSPAQHQRQLESQPLAQQPLRAPSLLAMPFPGSSAAPSFRNSEPEQLGRFFDDLEFAFERAKISDDSLRKRLAFRYVSVEVEELWKTLPEADPSSSATFNEFKTAVRALYPELTYYRSYLIVDLARLVEDWRSRIIKTQADYGEFYRAFQAIAGVLRSKGMLVPATEGEFFRRALETSTIGPVVDRRLRLIHHERPAYEIFTREEIHHAALLELPTLPRQQADDSMVQVSLVTIPSSSSRRLASAPCTPATNIQRPSAVALPSSTATECHYCGACNCFVRSCPVAQADINAGRCRRNEDGRLVLASGRFIPRALPGRTMRERMLEWYQQRSVESSQSSQDVVRSQPLVSLDGQRESSEGLASRTSSSRTQAARTDRVQQDREVSPSPTLSHQPPPSSLLCTPPIVTPSPSSSSLSSSELLSTLGSATAGAYEQSARIGLKSGAEWSSRTRAVEKDAQDLQDNSRLEAAVERGQSSMGRALARVGRVRTASERAPVAVSVKGQVLSTSLPTRFDSPSDVRSDLCKEATRIDKEIARLRECQPAALLDGLSILSARTRSFIRTPPARTSRISSAQVEGQGSDSGQSKDEAYDLRDDRGSDPKVVEDVFQRVLKAAVSLSLQELANLDPVLLASCSDSLTEDVQGEDASRVPKDPSLHSRRSRSPFHCLLQQSSPPPSLSQSRAPSGSSWACSQLESSRLPSHQPPPWSFSLSDPSREVSRSSSPSHSGPESRPRLNPKLYSGSPQPLLRSGSSQSLSLSHSSVLSPPPYTPHLTISQAFEASSQHS